MEKDKIKQTRITIPKWIAELKNWNSHIHLELVPLVKEDNKLITKETVFILKEVKKNE